MITWTLRVVFIIQLKIIKYIHIVLGIVNLIVVHDINLVFLVNYKPKLP